MSIYCDKATLKTESDVEQKFLYRLLSEETGLGFHAEEIKTKQFLKPLDIDKGAAKRTGYYPDYAIVLSALPIVVVEAKSPNENVHDGYREAQLYAHEINKGYPAGLNPVGFVIASNGHSLLYGYWDAQAVEIKFEDVVPGGAVFEELREMCGRAAATAHASALRSKLHPPFRHKALKFLGGPSKQNAELPPNRFAAQLVPLLKKYFSPDATRTNKELVERAYCSSNEITHYNSVLETLLKDNLAKYRFPSFAEVSTTKNQAHDFTTALRQAIEHSKLTPDALLLVIGNVGAGKSMFIDRYYFHLQDAFVREHTLWAFVDFNQAPANISGINRWMAEQVLEDLKARNNLSDFDDYEMLRRYFAPDILKRTRGAYKVLENQPDELNRRIADDLVEWMKDPENFLRNVLRYYIGDCGRRIVVVFDNADRRDNQQQLDIFQSVQFFRATYKTFAILCMRDETYDRYRHEPPLDAYLTPFAFRINPPRFLDVAKKRLELIISDLAEAVPNKQVFELPNGAKVEYAGNEIGRFLVGIYKALFNPTRQIRTVLEALAGRDVRMALQMFSEILMSGHLTDDIIFAAGVSPAEIRLNEWLVIRILMRTKYKYFSENHGYIVNLFGVDPESHTTNNFLLCLVLSFLAQNRKRQGELGIEGYKRVAVVVDHLAGFGFLEEDVLWAINFLSGCRLVGADNQKEGGIGRENYVKILASGFIHLRVLFKRLEYLSAISADTWLRDKFLAEEIARHADLNADSYDRKVHRHRARVERLVEALQGEYDLLRDQTLPPKERLALLDKTVDALDEVLRTDKHFFEEDELALE